MPSDMMDVKRFSSSSFLSDDRQVGFWKPDATVNHYVGCEKPLASSPLEKFMPKESQVMISSEHSQPDHRMQDQKVKVGIDMNAVGAERAVNRSSIMSRSLDLEMVQPMPYFAENNEITLTGTQYENNLFSSSFSELFSQKSVRSSLNIAPHGQSVDTFASHFEEEEPLESIEEIEAQTIGNLLPHDDDLLSGVTEGFEYNVQPNNGGDDLEELDFFSSIGGMDLGDDNSSIRQRNSEFPEQITNRELGSLAREHPYGENPSRTLFVRNINSNVEDSELKTLFEQYGDIHTLYTASKHRGFVMISYYDIRAAQNAMKALQNISFQRRKIDIHYSIPKDNPSEKDINQATLAVFNLDASISNDELVQIFGVFGEIKEIHETPHKSHHKFVEFYDVRAAESALHELNQSFIAGKRIQVEPCRLDGTRSLVPQFPPESERNEDGFYIQHNGSPSIVASGFSGSPGRRAILSTSMDNGTMLGMHSATQSKISPYQEAAFHHGVSSSVPNVLPSLGRVESAGYSQGMLKFDARSTHSFNPHSLPEYQGGLTNYSSSSTLAANINPRPAERIANRLERVSLIGRSVEPKEGVFGSPGNRSLPIPGHHYAWNNSFHHHPPGMMWSNSPSASFVNGMYPAHPTQRLHGLPRAPSHMVNTVLSSHNHHVGSAPAVNPSVWDMRPSYSGQSREASSFHPGSLGNMRIPNHSLHAMELNSQNIFPHSSGNGMDMPIPPNNAGLQSHQQSCMMFPGRTQAIPMMNLFDSHSERVRSRRNESGSNQADNKKQYELDIECIKRGEDNRTTLMIKNIPNKYTSKMLLAAIDERHRGTYDFLYLPIDFKNKCNVGYAFINMTDPCHIVPFYQAFNGKKWEKFNSEKVASIAYARIQGKSALISHFQNSSLMNEDKRCRPILFNTDGPNPGDQVPFPMGVNIRARPGKTRATTHEENHHGTSPSRINMEDFPSEDSSSASGRESD